MGWSRRWLLGRYMIQLHLIHHLSCVVIPVPLIEQPGPIYQAYTRGFSSSIPCLEADFFMLGILCSFVLLVLFWVTCIEKDFLDLHSMRDVTPGNSVQSVWIYVSSTRMGIITVKSAILLEGTIFVLWTMNIIWQENNFCNCPVKRRKDFY